MMNLSPNQGLRQPTTMWVFRRASTRTYYIPLLFAAFHPVNVRIAQVIRSTISRGRGVAVTVTSNNTSRGHHACEHVLREAMLLSRWPMPAARDLVVASLLVSLCSQHRLAAHVFYHNNRLTRWDHKNFDQTGLVAPSIMERPYYSAWC